MLEMWFYWTVLRVFESVRVHRQLMALPKMKLIKKIIGFIYNLKYAKKVSIIMKCLLIDILDVTTVTKVEGVTFENRIRNAQNAKIACRVMIRIFNELRRRFSITSAECPTVPLVQIWNDSEKYCSSDCAQIWRTDRRTTPHHKRPV